MKEGSKKMKVWSNVTQSLYFTYVKTGAQEVNLFFQVFMACEDQERGEREMWVGGWNPRQDNLIQWWQYNDQKGMV